MKIANTFGLRASICVAVLLGASGVLAAQGKVDVAGKWNLEVKTQAGGTTTPSSPSNKTAKSCPATTPL